MERRRELLVVGMIEEGTARDFLKEMREADDDGWRLIVKVCSRGGDFSSALAMHDALGKRPETIVVATGNCMSAALLLLLAVPKSRRLATENTIFMNHAVANTDGAELPPGLPAMKLLEKLPLGVFGVQRAIECDLICGLLD